MLSTQEIGDEIDQTLKQRGIAFLVRDDMRGFRYTGVPIAAGVLTDGDQSVVALAAVLVAQVEIGPDPSRSRAKFFASLDRLQKDFPLALLKFTEDNKVVWTFREIETEDFTAETFERELEELTSTATQIGPEVCGRLRTGVLGTQAGLVGLEQPTGHQPRVSNVFEKTLNHWLTATLMDHVQASADGPIEDETADGSGAAPNT